MKRSWIWIIPILAAVSAIWLQAAIHEASPGAATIRPAMPLEQRDTAAYRPHALDNPGDRVKFPPQPPEPPH